MKSKMMKGQNASVLLGILMAFFIFSFISADLTAWNVDMSCPKDSKGNVVYVSYKTMGNQNVPDASGTSVPVSNFWGGQTNQQSSASQQATLNPKCEEALKGMNLMNGFLVILGTIVLMYLVLHFFPTLGAE